MILKFINYEGKVYCIKVKDNENFLARTRGKIWWSGNSEFQYDYLRSRVRTTLNIPKKYRYRIPGIVCATNPGGLGHNFCKRRWVDFAKPYEIKKAPPKEGGMHRCYIPALLSDNKILQKTDPNYIDRLNALPEPYRTAYMKGDWDIFLGQAFNFSVSQHVCKPIPIPDRIKANLTI